MFVSREKNPAKHAVAIKPMGVPSEVAIDQGVASVADILASSKLRWKGTPMIARGQGLNSINGSEVAR